MRRRALICVYQISAPWAVKEPLNILLFLRLTTNDIVKQLHGKMDKCVIYFFNKKQKRTERGVEHHI